jgi:CubicO group peptidase (beta-lactamase class C family)
VRTPLPPDALFDWDLMVQSLAAEAPFWEPGTRNGYHALTFGFLVGEVVRRVSGRSLGTFFRDEVATPLGLDFWIGLPEDQEPRIAPQIPADSFGEDGGVPIFYATAFADPASIPGLIVFNSGGYLNPGAADTRAAHAAEIGASGAITNARGLAGMYASLATRRRSHRLLDQDTLTRMGRVASATGQDATILLPSRFAAGYVKSIDNRWMTPGNRDSVILAEALTRALGATRTPPPPTGGGALRRREPGLATRAADPRPPRGGRHRRSHASHGRRVGGVFPAARAGADPGSRGAGRRLRAASGRHRVVGLRERRPGTASPRRG